MDIKKLLQKEDSITRTAQERIQTIVAEELLKTGILNKDELKKKIMARIKAELPKYLRGGMKVGLDFTNES